MAKNRGNKTNLQLVLEHQKVPLTYYSHLIDKNRKQQGELATTLCQMAGVPMDRPASLNDIEAFEEVLGVCVMVASARLGNKFITSPSSDVRPCIYVYLTPSRALLASSVVPIFASPALNIMTTRSITNVTPLVSYVKRTSAPKRTHQ